MSTAAIVLIALAVGSALFGGSFMVCLCIGTSAMQASRTAPFEKSSAAPIAVAAADLMADYKANEVSADIKWKGKLVQVTGIIGAIKKDILDKPYVTVGTGARFELEAVMCRPRVGQETVMSSLARGQSVTVNGRVGGLMVDVKLDDCVIVSSGSEPAPAPAPRRR